MIRIPSDSLPSAPTLYIEKTRVFGCSTKWSDKREDAKRALARDHRDKVKGAKELHSAGMSRKEIAKEIGTTAKAVKKWLTKKK